MGQRVHQRGAPLMYGAARARLFELKPQSLRACKVLGFQTLRDARRHHLLLRG